MFLKRILLLLLLVCTVKVVKSQALTGKGSIESVTIINDFARSYYIQDMGFNIPDKWNKTLYDTIDVWLGSPYCYAGNTRNGVDCSGFVNTLYSNVYQSSIGARNSGDIYKKITKVDKDELTEGDLVFFRMRKKKITHVGLYLGNGKFVHASTSSGVIISDLSEPYYKKYYAGGGHLSGRMESNDITQ